MSHGFMHPAIPPVNQRVELARDLLLQVCLFERHGPIPCGASGLLAVEPVEPSARWRSWHELATRVCVAGRGWPGWDYQPPGGGQDEGLHVFDRDLHALVLPAALSDRQRAAFQRVAGARPMATPLVYASVIEAFMEAGVPLANPNGAPMNPRAAIRFLQEEARAAGLQ